MKFSFRLRFDYLHVTFDVDTVFWKTSLIVMDGINTRVAFEFIGGDKT